MSTGLRAGGEGKNRESEMVGWHHRLRGQEFEQAPREWCRTGKPGVLQGRKESDTTEQLNSHKSTGNGHDLVGRQRPEMSAVPPPQPTREKAQPDQC